MTAQISIRSIVISSTQTGALKAALRDIPDDITDHTKLYDMHTLAGCTSAQLLHLLPCSNMTRTDARDLAARFAEFCVRSAKLAHPDPSDRRTSDTLEKAFKAARKAASGSLDVAVAEADKALVWSGAILPAGRYEFIRAEQREYLAYLLEGA